MAKYAIFWIEWWPYWKIAAILKFCVARVIFLILARSGIHMHILVLVSKFERLFQLSAPLPVSNTLAQRRLRWFGDLQRMPPESEVLKLHNFSPGTIGWTRPRGRPRRRWIVAYLKTSQSSTFPSLRQFVSPIIASPGVLFFVVCPLRWMTSKSFKSSKS